MKKMNYHIIIEYCYAFAIIFLSWSLTCFIAAIVLTHKRDKAFDKTWKEYKGIVKGVNTSGLKEGDVYLSSTGELTSKH